MKNQYFGDKRDLLKFTLLEELARGVPGASLLSCIWMLTPPSHNNDGNRHFTVQGEGPGLAAFLKERLATGRRDVRELATYMASSSIAYFSYGDDPSQYFTATTRATYFASIPNSALCNAVVFFDPDNGLEPPVTMSLAHLKYEELRSAFDRMSDTSVAVVYQHLPRISAQIFWPMIAERVRQALSCPVGFVAAGDVGFLVSLRPAASMDRVWTSLQDLEKGWPTKLRVVMPR